MSDKDEKDTQDLELVGDENEQDDNEGEDIPEPDYVFGFGIVCVKDGKGFMLKDISADNVEHMTFARDATQMDFEHAINFMADKLRIDNIANAVINTMRNTPGKIMIPRGGKVH